MRKRSGLSIIEQAVVLVPEFEKVFRKLEQQVTLRGQSKSTLDNYIRRIALFVIHFEKLPEQIDPDEINEYLAALTRDPRLLGRSSFKHMVYGLRYYYRLLGMNKNAIALSSLKKEAKLPVIINHAEQKELFSAPNDAVQQAYQTKWVVHCEPSMACAEHVVKYLGQYTHRVAITNQRILNIADGEVTFVAKDYRDRAVKSL